MALQPCLSPRMLSRFRRVARFRANAARFLFALSLSFSCVSSANAQSSTQQYVYGSQSGSPSSVLSAYSKNSQTGALSAVAGSPFNERFEGGLVAIDGLGKFLFVLNPTSNEISMFQINQATGALSEVPASPFAVPSPNPTNPAPTSPSSIATEVSGKFLFLGYNSGDISGLSAVVSMSIDTSNASNPVLTTLDNVDSLLARPNQLLTDPKGLRLYVGQRQGQNGTLYGGAQVLSINATTGSLASVGDVDITAGLGRSVAMDPQGRFMFAGWGQLSGFIDTCVLSPVDGTAPNPSSAINIGNLIFPDAMLVDNSGKFLLIAQSQSGVVSTSVYSIDPVAGQLTLAQAANSNISFSIGTAVADPMGPYIYDFSFSTGNSIHAYQIDQQSGALTEIAGSPFNGGNSNLGAASGIAISGTPVQAVSGPAAVIFPTTANFGGITVGQTSPTQVFSIVDTGNQTLTINSISITGTNASSFSQTNTCGPTLAANANCSVSITFAPASVGALSATLQVSDNAPGSPQTLTLNGTGVAPAPAVALSPALPAFPTITEGTIGTPQTLTVTNSGTAALHVSSVAISGANPSDFSFTNNCTAAVAPAATCTIALVFNPIAPGTRNATLNITDDAAGSPQTVTLTAVANPAITAGPAPNGSTSASVNPGQTAQFQLQMTPGQGYTGTVSLSCSGAPLGAVCTAPSSLSLASGSTVLFTVSVTTSGGGMLPPPAANLFPSLAAPRALPFLALIRAFPLLVLVLTLLVTTKRREPLGIQPRVRRLAWAGFLASVFLGVLISAGGCGGGSAAMAPPPPIVTPPGTSTIIVMPSATAPSGSPLQFDPIKLTLTVQ